MKIEIFFLTNLNINNNNIFLIILKLPLKISNLSLNFFLMPKNNY